MYVEDVAEAFLCVLHHGVIGEVYNIGTEKERTVMDVAHDIRAYFKLPEDKIVHVRDRAFNDRYNSIMGALKVPRIAVFSCTKTTDSACSSYATLTLLLATEMYYNFQVK